MDKEDGGSGKVLGQIIDALEIFLRYRRQGSDSGGDEEDEGEEGEDGENEEGEEEEEPDGSSRGKDEDENEDEDEDEDEDEQSGRQAQRAR